MGEKWRLKLKILTEKTFKNIVRDKNLSIAENKLMMKTSSFF